MRPDPWQKEKSRKYNLSKLHKKKAKDDGKKKKTDVAAVVKKSEEKVGTFKFVQPSAPVPVPEADSGSEEGDYDVSRFEEGEEEAFDMSSLKVTITDYGLGWDDASLRPEELESLEAQVSPADLSLSDLDDMPDWLLTKLKANEALLRVPLDGIATVRQDRPKSLSVVDSSETKPVIKPADPLESMLDDLLDG